MNHKKTKKAFSSVFPAFALTLLLAFSFIATGCVFSSEKPAYPKNEDNDFIAEVDRVVSPIVGAGKIPFMPSGLTAASSEKIIFGPDEEENGFSVVGEAEARARETGKELRFYVSIGSEQLGDVRVLFTDDDLRQAGYEKNWIFFTRKMSSQSAPACKDLQIVSSGSIKNYCFPAVCDAPVCAHTFFKCRKWQINWVLKGKSGQEQSVYDTDARLREAFKRIC